MEAFFYILCIIVAIIILIYAISFVIALWPLFLGLFLLYVVCVLIYELYKYSKNLFLKKGRRFTVLYRLSGIIISALFVLGIITLAFLDKRIAIKGELRLAIEIILYGLLWTMAITTFIIGFSKILSRLKIPSLLSGIIIIGSIVYAILSIKSPENGNSTHIIYISLVISMVLLIKGLLGPLAIASSLSLAAYGIIHTGDYHIPLIKDLVVFILNESNLTIEYLISMVIAISALTNFIALDINTEDTVS